MKKINYKHCIRCLTVGFLGLGISLGASVCQAYFNGSPAHNSNYRPIYAHMGVEQYVDLSSIHMIKDKDNIIEFKVSIMHCQEDADTVDQYSSPVKFRVNTVTREAWVWLTREKNWSYLNLNRFPYGFEEGNFNTVNMCYSWLYGEFLNDSSGEAAAYGAYYKGN